MVGFIRGDEKFIRSLGGALINPSLRGAKRDYENYNQIINVTKQSAD